MKIAVIIPCYKVTDKVLSVLAAINNNVDAIYIIDDACPDHTGSMVRKHCTDKRIKVITHSQNYGVGAAVITGYKSAIEDGHEILVKIDGDGQMDPSLISLFIQPIILRKADYTKGNRFYNMESLDRMPKIRLFGNAILSFITKISSGYWNIFDPTNGYTAIHSDVLKKLPLNKISNRYFFESDMLFRLNTVRAVVVDIPMDANYSDEISNLKISKIIFEFLNKNTINFLKRIFYNYYLRDMSLASIELPLGIIFFIFGLVFGSLNWIESIYNNQAASSGTVMLAALPLIMGLQLILSFFSFDIANIPRRPRISL